MEYLGQQALNAVTLAGLYALVSLGVTLIFGLTGLVNFAHGEILMIGGYVVLAAISLGGSYFLGLVAAIFITLALGLVLERLIFRRTLAQPINGFIVSLGLITVFQNIVILAFGTDPKLVSTPLHGAWVVGGVHITVARAVALAVAAVLLAVYFYFTQSSRWGRALRACNENRQAAALLGVPTGLIIMWAFGVGSALAGVGGGLLSAIVPISPDVGGLFIIKAFAVALVGGLGNPRGVLAGSLLLGAVETFIPGTLVAVEWTPALAFLLMVATLLVRPQGLFRGHEGSAVS